MCPILIYVVSVTTSIFNTHHNFEEYFLEEQIAVERMVMFQHNKYVQNVEIIAVKDLSNCI